jgi:single-stranded DNA-binding protein
MSGTLIDNNTASIYGKIVSKPEFSHEVYGEGFYLVMIQVHRLSDSSDKIPVMFSERLVPVTSFDIGMNATIEGQFRSYNNFNSGDGHKLMLTVFAREFILTEEEVEQKNPNQVILNGFVCRKPMYRTTPFGREIADMLLAVNRAYNKSDYIPCIAWGRNARYAGSFEVGDNIRVWGRIQSRTYQKRISETEIDERIAYEVSISKLEILKSASSKDTTGESDLCMPNEQSEQI